MTKQQFHVAVIEDRYDPLKLGRYRVRVFGAHNENIVDVPVNKLPWAIPLSKNAGMSGIGLAPNFVEGTLVYVFFQDGESKQQPIILGAVAGVPVNKLTFPHGSPILEESMPIGNYPESVPPVEPPVPADKPISGGGSAPIITGGTPEPTVPGSDDTELSVEQLQENLTDQYDEALAAREETIANCPWDGIDEMYPEPDNPFDNDISILSDPAKLIGLSMLLTLSRKRGEDIAKVYTDLYNNKNLETTNISWGTDTSVINSYLLDSTYFDGDVPAAVDYIKTLTGETFDCESWLDMNTTPGTTHVTLPEPIDRNLPEHIWDVLKSLKRNIYISTANTSITTWTGHRDFGYLTTFYETTASYNLSPQTLLNMTVSVKGWSNSAQVKGGWSSIPAITYSTIDASPTTRYQSISGGVSDIGFTDFGIQKINFNKNNSKSREFIVNSILTIESFKLRKHVADIEFAYREELISRDEVYYYCPDLDRILPHPDYPDREPGTYTGSSMSVTAGLLKTVNYIKTLTSKTLKEKLNLLLIAQKDDIEQYISRSRASYSLSNTDIVLEESIAKLDIVITPVLTYSVNDLVFNSCIFELLLDKLKAYIEWVKNKETPEFGYGSISVDNRFDEYVPDGDGNLLIYPQDGIKTIVFVKEILILFLNKEFNFTVEKLL